MMKENILDAVASNIMLHGLRRFTIDDICAELGISKKTVYKYYAGKNALISSYFDAIVDHERASITQSLNSHDDIKTKLNRILHVWFKYSLTTGIMEEARKFFPEEWKKLELVKQYKLDAIRVVLNHSVEYGVIRQGVNFPVLITMVEKMSNMFLDYDFLNSNRLTLQEAIDEALSIILFGILENPLGV